MKSVVNFSHMYLHNKRQKFANTKIKIVPLYELTANVFTVEYHEYYIR